MSLRKDTLSHAYELLKVEDPKKRRRLAEQVARGELSLVKLREKIDGKPLVVREPSASGPDVEEVVDGVDVAEIELAPAPAVRCGHRRRRADRRQGNTWPTLLTSLPTCLASATVMGEIKEVDRQNLAKYLTIAKLRLENAINVVRSGKTFEH